MSETATVGQVLRHLTLQTEGHCDASLVLGTFKALTATEKKQ